MKINSVGNKQPFYFCWMVCSPKHGSGAIQLLLLLCVWFGWGFLFSCSSYCTFLNCVWLISFQKSVEFFQHSGHCPMCPYHQWDNSVWTQCSVARSFFSLCYFSSFLCSVSWTLSLLEIATSITTAVPVAYLLLLCLVGLLLIVYLPGSGAPRGS